MESLSSFLGWGGLSLGTPEPKGFGGQGSKERDGAIRHLQIETFDGLCLP